MFKEKRLKEKIEILEKFYKEKCEECNALKNTNNQLLKSTETTAQQNEQLIDWIYKIINEVGAYKINERDCVRIPLYRHETINYTGILEEPQQEEIIEIPKIVIQKFS